MALKLPRIKLHNQILLALILGAMFGAVFHISKYKIEINYLDQQGESQRVQIERWEQIEFLDVATGIGLARFGPEDQLAIIPFFNKLEKGAKKGTVVKVVQGTGEQNSFENIRSIQKVKTIATLIKPVGSLFIRLLMFVAIPLVLASLIVGASSLGDLKEVGRIGAKTIGIYMATTVVAITIGLVLVNAIQPGTRVGPEAREKLMMEFQGNVQEKLQQEASVDVVDMLVKIVSTNPIGSLANGEMLQIVFFALMVGICLTMIPQEKSVKVIGFFDGFSDLMIKMVDLIMKIAPYGVFALIAATVGEFGFDILQTLAWYAATLVIGLLIHMFVTIGGIVRFASKINPVRFFRGIRDVILISFSSSSSAATLPVNMECCEKNLGVPKKITSFVLPLGATINMDGTSMYQAVAAVFIAQVYGIPLDLTGQLTIILTAVLASIGTAPVPGVGLIMLIIILRSVNIPEEGIALILGIDRILDMCRTVVNVTGDAAVATVIARQEGVLAMKTMNAGR